VNAHGGQTGECGLLRAATISSVLLSGAEKPVGYGISPLVQTLRLACGSAPPSGKVRRQGGDWRDESISGCELARDHTPQSGLVYTQPMKERLATMETEIRLTILQPLCMLIPEGKLGPIAQLEEPPAHNRLVPGSNPGGPTSVSGYRMHAKESQKKPGFRPETCFIGKGAPQRGALSI
jgi:hypothetical protein